MRFKFAGRSGQYSATPSFLAGSRGFPHLSLSGFAQRTLDRGGNAADQIYPALSDGRIVHRLRNWELPSNLTRRANHRHVFVIAGVLELAPENRPRAFSVERRSLFHRILDDRFGQWACSPAGFAVRFEN